MTVALKIKVNNSIYIQINFFKTRTKRNQTIKMTQGVERKSAAQQIR